MHFAFKVLIWFNSSSHALFMKILQKLPWLSNVTFWYRVTINSHCLFLSSPLKSCDGEIIKLIWIAQQICALIIFLSKKLLQIVINLWRQLVSFPWKFSPFCKHCFAISESHTPMFCCIRQWWISAPASAEAVHQCIIASPLLAGCHTWYLYYLYSQLILILQQKGPKWVKKKTFSHDRTA